ncbi:hypothetical protein ACF0H5_005099 [Mactra antiquata]
MEAVVLVSGTNDVGRMVPECIVKDLFDLCDEIKQCSPSATVFISEILPRSQNQFIGCNLRPEYLVKWNRDATTVNTLLNQRVQSVPWIRLIRHPEFHTTSGPRRSLLSRDGLHLSFQGTSTLVQNINRELNYAVVLVSGTNDVGRMVPECIVKDLFDLCDEIKQCSPSATVFISEILPRSQNQFIGCNLRPEYLVKWNRDATTVNTLLNQRVQSVPWIRLIRHPEFHTTSGEICLRNN